jgi:hypothetical protein
MWMKGGYDNNPFYLRKEGNYLIFPITLPAILSLFLPSFFPSYNPSSNPSFLLQIVSPDHSVVVVTTTTTSKFTGKWVGGGDPSHFRRVNDDESG